MIHPSEPNKWNVQRWPSDMSRSFLYKAGNFETSRSRFGHNQFRPTRKKFNFNSF